MALKGERLKTAQRYNGAASKKIWSHQDLPAPWGEFGPSTRDFAWVTYDFQEQNRMKADGMLGSKTLAQILSLHPKEEIPPAPPIERSTPYGKLNPALNSKDGWDGPLSIADMHIWDERSDPDLSPNRIRPVEDVRGCVLHTTGYGKGVERLDRKFGGDLEAIDRAYARRMANILEYKGTFFIGRTGLLCHLAPLKYRTHHSASSFQSHYAKNHWYNTKRVYKRGKALRVNADFWPERFEHVKGLNSPLDFPVFQPGREGKRSINQHSWSIDLLAPRPNDTYTTAQYEVSARLIWFIHKTYGLPLDRLHIMGHEDVNPFDRTNAKGPWDPGPRWDWERVYQIFEELDKARWQVEL